MKTIAQIRDYDCKENRLLGFVTNYLNKKYKSDEHGVFYGEALNMISTYTVNNIKFFTINVNVYTKEGDCITVNRHDIAIDEKDGEIILRIHAVRELERKIHANKINKL